MSETTHKHGFRHEAFFYADADEFLGYAAPFVRAGLEREEAILVALPERNLELLRGALGADAERVRFTAMEALGRNPGRIISAWRDFVDAELTDRAGVRGIGEPIWASRTADELDECVRHESLLNVAFADDSGLTLMCPYSTTELDDATLSCAERTHPIVSRVGEVATSRPYADAGGHGDPFGGELRPPPGDAEAFPFVAERLADLRRFVERQADAARLNPAQTADLVLVANEAATNSVVHGGGEGSILVWRDGDAIVCEVRDSGRIDRDKPLIGRARAPAEQAGGRGLWIAHQLCDLVQVRSGEGGNAVRMRISL